MRRTRQLVRFVALPLLLLGAACGGGGGDDDGDGGPTFVEVTFPSGRCLAAGPTLTVRGLAPDPSLVTDVRVNDAPVDTADAYATWSVVVPLAPGENQLRVDVTDAQGTVHPDHVLLDVTNVGFFPLDVRAMVLDAASARLFAIDPRLRTLFVLDLDTGVRSVISGPARGSGTDFDDPEGLAVDVAGNRAWVSDGEQGLRAILQVNLTSGNRTVLSGSGVGIGDSFSNPLGLAYDAAGPRLLVVDQGFTREGIVAVDLASGNRTPVSTATVGTGTAFESPQDLEVDFALGRAYVTDDVLDAVVRVNLASGNRVLLSDDVTGTGATFDQPHGLALDPGASRLLVTDESRNGGALFGVDLATGNRTVLSDSDAIGTGGDLLEPADVVREAAGSTALVADRSHVLTRVALGTGARTPVTPDRVGSGIPLADLSGPWAVAVRPDGRRLQVLAHDGADVILEVNLATGARTAVSSSTVGSGVITNGARCLALPPSGAPLYLAASNAVHRFDPATGARALVSGASRGSGPLPTYVPDMAFDTDSGGLLLIAPNQDVLLRVDVASGDRTVVSDDSTGAGAGFLVPDFLAPDPAADRVYVADNAFPVSVIQVEMGTGNRTLLASNTTGAGGALPQAAGLGLEAPASRLLLISDFSELDAAEVWEVAVSDGDHVVVSDPWIGNGPNPVRPVDLVLDVARQRAFVVDSTVDAVFLYDVPPGGGPLGDRVIVTR